MSADINTNKNRSWKPWEPWEEEFIRKWYGKMPRKKIARYLNRTIPSLNEHAGRLGLRKKRQPNLRHRKYNLERAGINYKFVLPEENWPIVEHFLASFCRYAVIANKTGKKLDVRKFMNEYVKAYARKEVGLV